MDGNRACRPTGWLACLIGALVVPVAPGSAAPPRSVQFRARTVRQLPTGQATIGTRVWATRTMARADVDLPDGEVRFLLREGWVYQLYPARQIGRKYRVPAAARGGTPLEQLGRMLALDPGKTLRSMKKDGEERLDGQVCDIYEQTTTRGRVTRRLKLWMPRNLSLGLPVRAERHTEVRTQRGVTTEHVGVYITDIQIDVSIPAGTFALPGGYKISEGRPGRLILGQ